MGKKICFVLTCFWVGVCHAGENSIWQRFVKTGLGEYQNFEAIDFDEVSQNELHLPVSLEASRKNLTEFPIRNNKTREDEYEFKLLEEIQKREIFDLSDLEKLTIKQMLELAIDIAQRSMYYQYVRSTQKLDGWDSIHFTDCFIEGCGVCADYAYNLAHIFYWLKNYNPKLKNVWVLYSHGDTFESASADKANDLLIQGHSSTHAWNIIVYFTDDGKMVYSHIDLTGPENKYGRMKEGKVGYHLSENENVNLSKLLESVGETKKSLKLLRHEYSKSKGPVVERIRELNRLIQVSTQSEENAWSCKYYQELAKLVPDSEQFKKDIQSYCGTLL